MLPRLEAEETLARANAAALGSGAMRADRGRRFAAALERRARGGAPARLDPGSGAGRAALAMIGIAVEAAPRSSSPAEAGGHG